MAETKEISLADLGLEEEKTPAQSSVEKNKKFIKTKDGQTIEVKDVKVDQQQQEYKANKNSMIVIPDTENNKDLNQWSSVNISDFAKKPVSKPSDPVKDTMGNLYEKADDGISKQKRELTAPGGRIDEAKHKYIDYNYDILMKRAVDNDNLKKRIKFVEEILETDARFDNITDYERKAYILYKVAKDLEVGITDEDFGIETASVNRGPRNSKDASKEINKISSQNSFNKDDDNYLVSDDKFIIHETKPDIPFKESGKKVKEQKTENIQVNDDELNESLLKKEEDNIITENESLIQLDEDIKTIEDDNASTKNIPISDDELKERRKEYAAEVIKILHNNIGDDLDNFSIGGNIGLNSALESANKIIKNNVTTTWGLNSTGNSFELSPFSGEDIVQLSPETTDYETLNGLKKVFTILYRHIIGRKPDFEVWLKEIAESDIQSLFFGIYVSCFKDNNYITYECPNESCRKIYIEKIDIQKMVEYPNNDIKERFQKILNGERVPSNFLKERPKRISRNYAIGLMPRTAYSTFELISLTEEFRKDNAPIVSMLPVIDTFYLIDQENQKINPIEFGIVKGSIEKTVIRKVNAIKTILKTLSLDERTNLVREISEYDRKLGKEEITYMRPASKCPSCGHEFKPAHDHPINLLFTRAQLLIAPVYMQE